MHIYVMCNYPTMGTQVTNKKHIDKNVLPLLGLLTSETPTEPQILQAIAHIFGYLQNMMVRRCC